MKTDFLTQHMLPCHQSCSSLFIVENMRCSDINDIDGLKCANSFEPGVFPHCARQLTASL